MHSINTPPASPAEVERIESEQVFGTGPITPPESSEDENCMVQSSVFETPVEALITVKTRCGRDVRNAPRRIHTKRICVRMEPDEKNLTTALEFSIIEPPTPRRCPGAPKKTRVCVRVDLKKLIPFPNINNM